MENGVLGDPGAPAISILERRQEQGTAITLKMEVPPVLALQVKQITAQ